MHVLLPSLASSEIQASLYLPALRMAVVYLQLITLLEHALL